MDDLKYTSPSNMESSIKLNEGSMQTIINEADQMIQHMEINETLYNKIKPKKYKKNHSLLRHRPHREDAGYSTLCNTHTSNLGSIKRLDCYGSKYSRDHSIHINDTSLITGTVAAKNKSVIKNRLKNQISMFKSPTINTEEDPINV